MDTYWRAPPIARTVATAAFVTSLSIFLGVLPAHWFVFWNEKAFTFPPQIWRVWSNFLITGSGLSLLFDTYFLYTYTSALEVGNPRFSKREDLVWYLLFVGGVITVSYACPLHVLHATPDTLCPLLSLSVAKTNKNTSSICPHSVFPQL